MAPVRRGLKILRTDGIAAFLHSTKSYTRNSMKNVYWKLLRSSYSLSINDVRVSFSAPSRSAVLNNQLRYESERAIISDLLSEIEGTDVFYDIGANTGIYTLFAAKSCGQGTVISFEPYPPNVELLRKDVERNRLDNVKVFEVALSDSTGTVSFRQPQNDEVGYGSASIAEDSEKTIEVPTTTGDKLVNEGKASSPDIIKIDVEGAEPLVLDGLRTTLSRSSCRLVYCEVHLSESDDRPSIHNFDTNLDDIQSLFRENGFQVATIESRESEVFLKAKRE